MTECYQTSLEFPSVKRRKVEADFSGGAITSNGGISLLSQVDRQMGLMQAVARVIGDSRRQASCAHSLLALLRQRVYALALGYEDLNDHHELRNDLALQTATSRVETLASPSTQCRLEQRTGRQTAVAFHEVLFEQFVKAHDKPPRRLIVKAEHSRLGSNPCFVVTNLKQGDQYLYDKLYCARGDMENRIKDQQLDLFAGRTSSHRWWPRLERNR